MKKIIGLIFVLISFASLAQEKKTITVDQDYALAKVGIRIHGVYVFFLAEPFFDYEYIATVKVKINWKSHRKSFEKLIKKSKKKHANFNGIIVQSTDLRKADLIRFNELGVSEAGFTIGDKVSFIKDEQFKVAEVVKLGTSKDDISVKWNDTRGNPIIMEIKAKELTPISENVYQKNVNPNSGSTNNDSTITNSDELQIGDIVEWRNGNKIMKGEITSFEGDKAKIKGNGVLKINYLIDLDKLEKFDE